MLVRKQMYSICMFFEDYYYVGYVNGSLVKTRNGSWSVQNVHNRLIGNVQDWPNKCTLKQVAGTAEVVALNVISRTPSFDKITSTRLISISLTFMQILRCQSKEIMQIDPHQPRRLKLEGQQMYKEQCCVIWTSTAYKTNLKNWLRRLNPWKRRLYL